MKRPMAVWVIGGGWIALGVVMCVIALLLFQMYAVLAGPFLFIAGAELAEAPPLLLSIVLPGIALLIDVWIAILGIVAGASFLKMRAWARRRLEVLSWLRCIIGIAAGATACMVFWRWRPAAVWQVQELLTPLLYWLVMNAALTVPFAAMVLGLRSKKVREAIGRATVVDAESATA